MKLYWVQYWKSIDCHLAVRDCTVTDHEGLTHLNARADIEISEICSFDASHVSEVPNDAKRTHRGK